eukprot:g2690.t1
MIGLSAWIQVVDDINIHVGGEDGASRVSLGYAADTRTGIVFGSSMSCAYWILFLVSVLLASKPRTVWIAPRNARWLTAGHAVASFLRVQSSIEAIAKYDSARDWPFGEENDAEVNSYAAQIVRLVRFCVLLVFTAFLFSQRDSPTSDFSEAPTDEQIAAFERQKYNDADTGEGALESLSRPLLSDAENDGDNSETTKDAENDNYYDDDDDRAGIPKNAEWTKTLPSEAISILRRRKSECGESSELYDRIDRKKQRSNEVGASIFEMMTFSWMNSQVDAGSKAPLRPQQLHLLQGTDLPDENARAILDAYISSGGGQHSNDEDFRQRASVIWTIVRVYRWPLLGALALSSFKVLVTLAQPMVLQEVIRAIERPVDDDDDNSTSPHWIGMLTMQVNRTMGRVGAQIRGGFTAIIYAKGLKLTQAARQKVGEGKIVSLMEVDCAKLEWGIYTAMNVFSLILILVGAVTLLWHLAGASAMASLIVMFVLFIPSTWAMSNAIPHWPKTMALKDRRVRLLTELLQSMRLIKSLGWDGAMLDRVQEQRKDEVTERFMLVSWFSVLWSIGMSSPVLINLSTLLWYVLATGKTLTASLGAPLFQLTSIIQGPVNGLPTSLGVLLQVNVSLQRIDTFLKQEEICTGRLGGHGASSSSSSSSSSTVESPAVVHRKSAGTRYFRSEIKGALGKVRRSEETSEGKISTAAEESVARDVAVRMKNVDAIWGAVEDQDEKIFKSAKRDAAARRKHGTSSFCCRVLYRSLCCCCGGGARRRDKDDDLRKERNNDGDDAASKEDVDEKDDDGVASKTEAAVPKPALRNVNLTIPSGELLVVLGKVGSGKSTLLSAMLNEVALGEKSVVEISGKVAYCAQQPWIQNLNLRKNILFGLPFDAERYARAVSAASLWHDFSELSDGDRTEIGERGLTLSGGQKARVALARAVYANADITILDDIFSAVDPHVATELAEKCVLGALKDKTRILVTHAVGLLQRLDRASEGRMTLVVVDEGTIKHVGSYAAIMSLGLDITSYASAGGDVKDDNENTPPAAKEIEGTDEENDAGGVPLKRMSTNTSTSSVKTKDEATKENRPKKLVRDENRAIGSVKFAVWKHFFVTFGWFYTIVFLVAAALGNGARLANSFWLASWMDSGEKSKQVYYIGIYAALQMFSVVCIVTWIVDLAFGRYTMSLVVHRESLWGVFRSPMSYFDSQRLGRIINRFSADLNSVDTELCWNVVLLINCVISVLFSLSYIFATNYWILVLVFPMTYFYYYTMERYRASARELKRLASVTRSPVFSAFTEALNGASTVRAFRADERFNQKHLRRLELNIGANLNQQALQQWLDLRLSLISIGLLAPVIFVGLLQHLEQWNVAAMGSSFSAGVFSVAIGKCSEVSASLETLIRQFTSAETALVCMERLLALQKLKPEPPLFIKGEEALQRENEELRRRAARRSDGVDSSVARSGGYVAVADDTEEGIVRVRMTDSWPTKGRIAFENVSMRYREDLPLRLRSLSLVVPEGARVGVCGRTGAGKSSIFQALLRLTPIEKDGGRILIDDVNITTEVGLQKLRSRLAYIPQSPDLFSGTIRSNIDPFSEYSDDELWEALALVQLDDFVRKGGQHAKSEGGASKVVHDENESPRATENPLDMIVSERGDNYSVGQRQLLCLARALVRRSKILLMDEATASVDTATDALIQKALRLFVEKTKSTVLTIAHRIDTIVRSDIIIVMEKGRVRETGSPTELLADPTSEFSKLCAEARTGNSRLVGAPSD